MDIYFAGLETLDVMTSSLYVDFPIADPALECSWGIGQSFDLRLLPSGRWSLSGCQRNSDSPI